MTREDMILLMEAYDDLMGMDHVLQSLTGLGHSSGQFIHLDNIYEVLRNNCHSSYQELPEEEIDNVLLQTIDDPELTVEERVDLFLNGR